MRISVNIDENIVLLKRLFPVGRSFDIVTRELCLGATRAYMVAINGMYNVDVMQMILSDLQNPEFYRSRNIRKLKDYIQAKTSFGQVSLCSDIDEILDNVVKGPAAIFVDGFDEAIVIDLRKYPSRSIEEPENEKVMRGAKDGFVETLLVNANMIRRRIRNFSLTFESGTIGSDSKTEVAMAYVGDRAKPWLLQSVRDKLDKIDVDALTLGYKSLEELIVKKRWFNPLPSIQMTERPDVACSYLMEGYVLLLVDNSPAALVLPGNIFQFSQNPDDYYNNPIVGNMFRFIRNICTLLSLYILPVYVLIACHLTDLASKMNIIENGRTDVVELLLFIIFAEFGIDLLQYTSSHSHGALMTPISIVGGLVLSDTAIEMNLFSKEVLFYAAITLLSTYMISSHEFSDGLRLYRILLIVLSGFFGVYGMVAGTLLTIISVVTTPTFAGTSYLWPLIPFNKRALKAVVLRITTREAQPERERIKG